MHRTVERIVVPYETARETNQNIRGSSRRKGRNTPIGGGQQGDRCGKRDHDHDKKPESREAWHANSPKGSDDSRHGRVAEKSFPIVAERKAVTSKAFQYSIRTQVYTLVSSCVRRITAFARFGGRV
jgi:hypothetical protein